MSNKPPFTIKECIVELITVIEEISRYNVKDRAKMILIVRDQLVAYRKLKEYIEEQE